MKSLLIFILITVFLGCTYFATKYFQKLVKPRQSFGRLALYMLGILVIIFLLSLTLIFIIIRLYPSEYIK